jgi:cytochrome c553
MKKKVLSLNCLAVLMAFTFLNQSVYAADNKQIIENNTLFPNSAGSSATFSTDGFIDKNNEFFQSLGTNDRSCVTCHQAEEGWSVTPKGIQKRFSETKGTDPIFRPNDGTNFQKANVSTVAARRDAYSLLLNKGVFRIALKMPKNAEFELVNVSNPYDSVNPKDINADFEFSLFRRPLPSTNLKFLSAVMWDGRETISGQTIQEDLYNQANNATTGHAQGVDLTHLQRQHIVDFEMALFTSQVHDKKAKSLTVLSSTGDLTNLSEQDFYSGINDFVGDSKTGLPHDAKVFNLFDGWNNLIATKPTDIRAAIARGQHLFNTKPITISGVSGLNNSAEFGNANVIVGTCGTCHDTPNAGSHSVGRFFNLGISDASRRTADMPLYTLRNKTTGEIVKTTDAGRGLITGNWQDIGRFKIPTLRGLASRPPYFHNGMAKEIGNVLDFYDQRFHIGFDNRERMDLILFLNSL